jgi:hypothetical protein
MSPRRLLVPSLLALSLFGCRKEVEPGKDGDVDQGDDGGDDGQAEPEPEPLAFSLTGPDDGVFETGANVSVTGTWSGGLDPVLTVNGAASSPAVQPCGVVSPPSAPCARSTLQQPMRVGVGASESIASMSGVQPARLVALAISAE